MAATEDSAGLINRTFRTFRRAWRGAGLGGSVSKDGVEPDLPAADAARLREQLDACLEARGGEVAARTRAAELGATYLALNETGRRRFLDILAADYALDPGVVMESVESLRQAPDFHAAAAALRNALVPPRVRLLTRFNQLSLGVKFLVDLRADILGERDRSDALNGLERDLQRLLVSWFDAGFLELRRITWNTPAALLEKLIEYEAVHAIRSWDDLKRRLDTNRRCYAFFHPSMPDEPLIFVQVALVTGLAGNIHELLDEQEHPEPEEAADTAIFYSISNCQAGLAGVSFGNYLIKQVAADLTRDLPNIKTLSTLSPVPGFRGWLKARLEGAGTNGSGPLLPTADEAEGESDEGAGASIEHLRAVVEDPARMMEPGEQAARDALRPALTRLCAQYLLGARDGRAPDRVAHFHLSNGARVERVNWLGDTSEQGLGQSLGFMVNYRYLLPDVDRNHESYTSQGKIKSAAAVRKLTKP